MDQTTSSQRTKSKWIIALLFTFILAIGVYYSGALLRMSPYYLNLPLVDVTNEIAFRESLTHADPTVPIIRKLDSKTDLPVPCVKLTLHKPLLRDIEKVVIRIPYEGASYDLHFSNNVLQGYLPAIDSLAELSAQLDGKELQTDEEMMVALLQAYKEQFALLYPEWPARSV